VVVLGAILPALGLGPVVRSQVARRAAERGLTVEVRTVRPAWGGVWLRNVAVASGDGRIRGTLDAVYAPVGGGTVEVHGGRIELRGTPAQLREALRGSAKREGNGAGSARRRLRIDGLELGWRELDERVTELRAWGVAFERAESDRVHVDLAKASGRGVVLVARAAQAELTRGGELGKNLRIAALDASLEGSALRGSPAGSATLAAAGPVGASAEAGGSWAAWLEQGRKLGAERVPLGASFVVDAARADLRFGDEQLGFGPSRVQLKRDAAELTLEIAPGERGAANATPLALRGHLPLPSGQPVVELEGGPVSLSVLGVREGALGLTRTREATVEAHLRLELTPAGTLRATGSGALANWSLQRKELGPNELRGIRAGFRGDAEVALDGSLVKLVDSELSFGDVRVTGALELSRGAHGVRARVEAGVPLASCEAMLASLPAALVGELNGLRMAGTFALTSSLAFDSSKPADLAVKLSVQNGCRVVDAPPALSPERFRQPFAREVKAPDGSMVLVQSGPGTTDWVPYSKISRNMETAVLICEDGGFFGHRGFDFRAIEKAIHADVKAGRFVRGASTISMQLAKNLYLGREKTLSRKLQEALLTMLLEERLSKQELMELYLNVVELGPGIYGVEQAAQHYFATSASELTLGQALYLASILPDPTRQHFDTDGRVTARWGAYLQKLMHIARKVKRIDDAELDAGLSEEVAFRKPGDVLPGPGQNAESAPEEDALSGDDLLGP
jgi:monofunctional biosynthetic peptidoglycan transglycosylase